MKIRVLPIALLCILLSGCGNTGSKPEQPAEPVPVETTVEETAAAAAGAVINPLPDTTMDARDDSIVHVSFVQDDIYRDEQGKVVLRVQIYAYDQFDMVDISALKAGDTIYLSGEAVTVNALERNEHGTVLINGGLDEGGFDLATDDGGIYYAQGYSDMKFWNPVGEAEYLVSDDFVFTDSANLELGELSYSVQDLLDGMPDPVFGYQPQNTTVRTENGMVVEMSRVYTP